MVEKDGRVQTDGNVEREMLKWREFLGRERG